MQNRWFENGINLGFYEGDITTQKVDAIVNAANSLLQHGGGLAGRISVRGGPVIEKESAAWIAKFGSVSHSNPAYTHGGNLPCKFVIHAVGPIWGEGDEKLKIGICTSACLALAEKLGLQSIAYPAISTGIYQVPLEIAAEGMLEAIRNYSREHPNGQIKEIRMVLFEKNALDVFIKVQVRLSGEK